MNLRAKLGLVSFALWAAESGGRAHGRTRGANAAGGGRRTEVIGVPDIRNNGIENENETYAYYKRPFDHFSKVKFLDEALADALLPIEDYPLDESLGDILKTQSMASSPMTASDLDVDVNILIDAVGGLPSFPGEQEFWDELLNVALIQALRMYNGTPPFPLPDVWNGFDIAAVAEAVHDEYPGFWHQKLLESFWGEGLTMDFKILEFHSNVDFVGSTVRLADLNTWAIGVVCPPNFLLKWSVGKLRPEEAAFQIEKNLLKGVPQYVQSVIKWMGLQTPEQFTAYPEGSPTHPSWPAMHSAASAASLWLAVVADLTEEQYCQVLRTDYGVAFARTVAGVHYASDNIAGLNLGQHLVANALPEHLASTYGASKAAVEAKIARLRFDWATFDPNNCTVVYDS